MQEDSNSYTKADNAPRGGSSVGPKNPEKFKVEI